MSGDLFVVSCEPTYVGIMNICGHGIFQRHDSRTDSLIASPSQFFLLLLIMLVACENKEYCVRLVRPLVELLISPGMTNYLLILQDGEGLAFPVARMNTIPIGHFDPSLGGHAAPAVPQFALFISSSRPRQPIHIFVKSVCSRSHSNGDLQTGSEKLI